MADLPTSLADRKAPPWVREAEQGRREAEARRQVEVARSAAAGVSFRLEAGESVLWVGQPRRGLVINDDDIMHAAVGLVFLCLASVQHTFVNPFLIFGLIQLFGPVLLDWWYRDKLLYAVTDRRVVMQRGRGRSWSMRYADMPHLELLSVGRLGTILLQKPKTFWTSRQRFWSGGAWGAPAKLFQIDAAERVHRLIEERRKAD